MENGMLSNWIKLPFYLLQFFSNITIGILFLFFFGIFKTLDKPEQARGFRNSALIAIIPIFAAAIFTFLLGGLFTLIVDSKYAPETIKPTLSLLPSLFWVYICCFFIPSCVFFIIWIIILILINLYKNRYEKAMVYLLSLFVALVATYFWWTSRGYGTFSKNWGW
jgi:hypothetical protein